MRSCEQGPSSFRNWRRRLVALHGTKLPMVDPGKNPILGSVLTLGGSLNGRAKSAVDRNNVDRWEVCLNRCRTVGEIVARNVDRDIGCGRNRLEKNWSLGRRACPKFDDRSSSWNVPSNFRNDALQQFGFGPRRIVGAQPGDLIEQLRASVVVKPAGRNRRDWRRKTGENIRSKLRISSPVQALNP